jgi:serine/threonine-protein phosphatase 2A catalytic subunit
MAASIPMERSYQDLEEWLAKLSQGMPLAESEVRLLCDLARETFLQESNVQPVSAPVTVCGDIHGTCIRTYWTQDTLCVV